MDFICLAFFILLAASSLITGLSSASIGKVVHFLDDHDMHFVEYIYQQLCHLLEKEIRKALSSAIDVLFPYNIVITA